MAAEKERVLLCSHLRLHESSHNIPSSKNHFLLASPAAGNAAAWACLSFNQSKELDEHKSDDLLSDIWALGSPGETVPEPPALILHEVPEVAQLLCINIFPFPAMEMPHLCGSIEPTTQPETVQSDLQMREKSFSCKWKTFWLKPVKL